MSKDDKKLVPFDDLSGSRDNPISPDDVKPMITAGSVATGFQLCGNAVARQVLANLKFAFDNNLSSKEIYDKHGYGFFTRGISSRFLYQGIGMLPALLVSDKMMESGYSPWAASAAASSYETVVGTAMEARSASIAFGLEKPMQAAARAVLPFTLRNYLGWIVLNTKHDSLLEKTAYGFGAGIISAIPDTIGNKMMMKGSGLDIVGSFRAAIKGINPVSLSMSMPLRGVAGAASAVLLSDEAKEFIADKVFNPMIASLRSSTQGSSKSDEVREASLTGVKEAKPLAAEKDKSKSR